MTGWHAAPDQAHIRSPLVAAAPTSRVRRVGLRRPGPFFRSAVKGHEDPSPRPSLSGRCRLGEATFAGMGGKEEDAPGAVIPFATIGRQSATLFGPCRKVS